jgi:hypothetical protein
MAKKKLKIDQLAKLRQFTKGMNVEEFLSDQFRQIIRALEQAYVDQDEVSVVNNTITNDKLVFLASVQGGLSGTIPLTLNTYSYVFDGGSVTSNTFYPSVSGTYYIEWGCSTNGDTDIGTKSANIKAFTSGGTLIASADAIHIASLNHGPYNTWDPSNGVFYTLGPTTGIYFTSTVSNMVAEKFFCKIFKVN